MPHDVVTRDALRLALAAVVVAASVAGCTGAEPKSGSERESGPGTSVAITPRIGQDFPDPDVLEYDGRYYAYATNSASANVQVATSDDLSKWTVSDDDALPDLPPWARTGDTWAPEVTRIGDGLVLYFTAANIQAGRQCIGVATATSPEGPFSPVGEPVICPEESGGAIDATTFRSEDGGLSLLWKNDGNCCGLPTDIHFTPLSDDGLAVAGEDRVLVTNDLPWEGDVIEAPTLVERDGRLHLFYSAGFYGDDSYSIGHATAASLDGPWVKDDVPLVSSESTDYQIVGPGGQDVVTDSGGDDLLVLHGWDDVLSKRSMYIVPLTWDRGQPVVEIPPREQ